MTIDLEAEAAAREENNAALVAALDEKSLSEVESSWELDVLNDAEHGRWIATLGAEAIAELPYRFVGGRVVLLSTWVDPVYRNNRVATERVARVLDEIRESGKKITIICPVVGKFAAYMAPSALGAPLGGRFTPSGSPTPRHDHLPGRNDRHHHIDRHRHTGVVHHRNHRRWRLQGIAISAATRGLLHGSTVADRAPIFSAIYLICYSAAAFPASSPVNFPTPFSLPQIALGYGGLAIVATLFTVLAARNPHTDMTGNSQHGE